MSSKTIILFSLMTILSLPLGEAATITVGPEGCDHVGIQAAIDAASPGDVVSVQNGTYRENLVVDKPIVLRNSGDGTDRPIVDAGGRGSAVTLVADGVTLQGFVLENGGFGWAGIEVRSKENAIRGNLITDNRWYGIFLEGAEGCVIEENVVWMNKYGIWINAGSRENLLRKNVLQDNENYNAFDLGTNLWEGNFYGDYDGSRLIYEVPGISSVDSHPSGPEKVVAAEEPPTVAGDAPVQSEPEVEGPDLSSNSNASVGAYGGDAGLIDLNLTDLDSTNGSTTESPPSNLTEEPSPVFEPRKRPQINILELSQVLSDSSDEEAEAEEEKPGPEVSPGTSAGDGTVDASRAEVEEANEAVEDGGTPDEPTSNETTEEAPAAANYTAEDWTIWGRSLASSGRYTEAVSCFDRALLIDPGLAAAWDGKGEALMMIGRYDKALTSFEKALAIEPESAEIWCHRGNALQMLLRFDDALGCYDEALKINPQLAEAWNRKGTTLNRLGRYSEALDCFDRALEIDPGLASAWNSKSWALQMLGEDEAAKEAFDRARGLG